MGCRHARTRTAERLANGEVSLALTPVVLVAVVASVVVVIIRSRTRPPLGAVGEACLACAITVASLIVLPVKFGWGSLWRIPWTIVPGAVGIRAIDRVMMVAGLFAVIAVGRGILSSSTCKVSTVGPVRLP